MGFGIAYSPPDVGYAETSSATEHLANVNKDFTHHDPMWHDLRQCTYNRHQKSANTKQQQQSLQLHR